MARSLNCWCSVAGGSYGNLRVGPPSDDGCSEFLPFRQKELFGKTVSVSGRRSTSLQDACETRVLQLRCMSTRNSSRSPRSTTEGERGVSVAERRKDKPNQTEPRLSRKSGHPGPSFGRGVHEDSLDVNVVPHSKLLVWRSNSCHTHQAGVPREVSRQPEAGSRKHQAGGILSSDSNLGCEHFSRCSGCVIENALDRPLLQDAVQFFRSYGISDFSLTSGS